jgi:hypothetical protein
MARALRCGVVALALLAMVACGSGTSAGSSSPTPSISPSATSIPTVGTTPTPTAAGPGTVGETFIFTNTSQTTCQLYGYPGMQMLGANGEKVPTNVVRTPGPEETVTLAPGGTASFQAQWHDQTGYMTPCPSSQRIEVTPPNAYSQLTITASITACPDGTINVTAVTAGSTGGQ